MVLDQREKILPLSCLLLSVLWHKHTRTASQPFICLLCPRCPRAVTAFSPGSATALPGTSTSFSNLFFAGDFVAQGPGTHGAKGLSQEKAFVAGLTAGNKVSID